MLRAFIDSEQSFLLIDFGSFLLAQADQLAQHFYIEAFSIVPNM